jgi:hypothetical protein
MLRPAPYFERRKMIEQHTLEIAFGAELVASISGKHGTTTLYRTPEDTYVVYMDMRHIAEDVLPGAPRDAVLDDGHAGLGHSESFVRHHWPELFTSQARQ